MAPALTSEIDLHALARRFVDFGRYVVDERERHVRGIERERSRFRMHIATARFAEKPLKDVTTRDIEEWVNELRTKNAQSTKHIKKLDPSTINRTRSLCTVILARAVELGLIETNPAATVRLPTERRSDDELKYLTIDELRIIESCEAIPEFDRCMVMFAAGTGLTAGEQFQLKISDLHVEATPPYVRVRVGAGGHAIPHRTVDLLGPAANAARRLLSLMPSYAPANPDNLLFPSRKGNYRQDGKPLGRDGSIHKLLEAAEIHRDISWKDLRHTCAVSMVSGAWGIHYNLPDVAAMLGTNVQSAVQYARFAKTQLGTGARPRSAPGAPSYQPSKETRPAPRTPVSVVGEHAVKDHLPNPAYSLTDCARDLHKDEPEVSRWLRAIERKRQLILVGPPGTGKTFSAERLARHLIADGTGISELIQFHPSYGYEDFIQGIRPESGADGSLRYPIVEGRFLNFCRRATGRDRSVLIVDEINRANVARVLGELLYLLEYRDKEIPLSTGNIFKIPENVVLIGTMNSADRSIALMDHALRRRFAFATLEPDLEGLIRYHKARTTGFDTKGLVAVLRRINRTIDDAHYAVGVSFFMRTDLATDDVLEDIWRLEIEPYLDELFFDQRAKVTAFRWEAIASEVEP